MDGRSSSRVLVVAIISLVLVQLAHARDVVARFDAALADFIPDQSVVYKTVGTKELLLNIYEPTGDPLPARPAILWFHGGGWTGGIPDYLGPHAAYFAGLGYLCVTAEYRLAGSGGLTTFDCIEDARDAFYWMVANAETLGIDPSQIVVAGESAGGHLAGCVGNIVDPRTTGIPTPQPYPAATILINPITDITSLSWAMGTAGLALSETALGESISPLLHIDSADPPSLLLHGAVDSVVPTSQSSDFATGMQAIDQAAHLRLWEGKDHAFFLYIPQFSLEDKPVIQASLLEIEAFLQSLRLNGYPVVHGHFSQLRLFAGPDGFRSFSSLTVVGPLLFGSTYQGGSSDDGTLFYMDPDTRNYQLLHEFSGTDGREPFNGLAVDGSTLYGVCKFGGTGNDGTLFTIQTDGSGFSILHNFDRTGTHNSFYPHAAPVLVDGALYGTSYHGGTTVWGGSIYRFTLPAGPFEILHSFSSATGRYPTGRLLQVGDWLYGTASDFFEHGSGYHGTLYRIHRTTGQFELLYAFNGTTEGGHPYDELVYDGSDQLFGTAFGIPGDASSKGTVFAYSISNDTLTVLHDFSLAPGTGSKPNGSLLSIDNSGFLYGHAHGSNDPAGEPGVLFRIKEDGSRFDTLHRFSGSLAGNTPMRGMVHLDNSIFGVTAFGGQTTDSSNPETGGGMIFRYTPVAAPQPSRQAYVSWLSQNGLLVNQSPDTHTDDDRFSLIEEFAYNGSPDANDSLQAITLDFTGDLVATVPAIRTEALPMGTLNDSENLTDWVPASGFTPSTSPHPTMPGFSVLSYEWPASVLQDGPLFLLFDIALEP